MIRITSNRNCIIYNIYKFTFFGKKHSIIMPFAIINLNDNFVFITSDMTNFPYRNFLAIDIENRITVFISSGVNSVSSIEIILRHVLNNLCFFPHSFIMFVIFPNVAFLELKQKPYVYLSASKIVWHGILVVSYIRQPEI